MGPDAESERESESSGSSPSSSSVEEESVAAGHGEGVRLDQRSEDEGGHKKAKKKRRKKKKKKGKSRKDKKAKKEKKKKKDRKKRKQREDDYSGESSEDEGGEDRKKKRRLESDTGKRRSRSRSEGGAERKKRKEYPREVKSRRKRPTMWDVRPEDLPDELKPRANMINSSTSTYQRMKHARRIYVGGLDGESERELHEFFEDLLRKVLVDRADHQIISVFVHNDRKFGFVEVNSVELATAMMSLDGIQMGNRILRVKRPKDYKPHEVQNEGPTPKLYLSKAPKSDQMGAGISNLVSDGPNKLFVGGLPHHLDERAVADLLEPFGKVKALKLIRMPNSNLSKGYAFAEYEDPSVTDTAVEGLNGLKINERVLTVRRSEENASGGPQNETLGSEVDVSKLSGSALLAMSGTEVLEGAALPTRVLVLHNVVTKEILNDEEEREDVKLDAEEECKMFGNVRNVLIPAATDPIAPLDVYVEFLEAHEALLASMQLRGRSFENREVSCSFMEEDKFYSALIKSETK